MSKINLGYRYECPTCGYTYEYCNMGEIPDTDYLCPQHKCVMAVTPIRRGDPGTRPIVRKRQPELPMKKCTECKYCEAYSPAGMLMKRYSCTHNDRTKHLQAGCDILPGFIDWGSEETGSPLKQKEPPKWCPLRYQEYK